MRTNMIRAFALGAFAATLALAGGATAQDNETATTERAFSTSFSSSASSAEAAADELISRLVAGAAELGLEAPTPDRALFVRLMTAALIELPEDDTRGFGFSSNFDIDTSVTNGVLAPHPEGWRVLDDPADCFSGENAHTVVEFAPVEAEGMRGHRCVVAATGLIEEGDGDIQLLAVATVMESAERRLVAIYRAALAIENDPEGAREVMLAYRDANVALADAITAYGLRVALARPIPAQED